MLDVEVQGDSKDLVDSRYDADSILHIESAMNL